MRITREDNYDVSVKDLIIEGQKQKQNIVAICKYLAFIQKVILGHNIQNDDIKGIFGGDKVAIRLQLVGTKQDGTRVDVEYYVKINKKKNIVEGGKSFYYVLNEEKVTGTLTDNTGQVVFDGELPQVDYSGNKQILRKVYKCLCKDTKKEVFEENEYITSDLLNSCFENIAQLYKIADVKEVEKLYRTHFDYGSYVFMIYASDILLHKASQYFTEFNKSSHSVSKDGLELLKVISEFASPFF